MVIKGGTEIMVLINNLRQEKVGRKWSVAKNLRQRIIDGSKNGKNNERQQKVLKIILQARILNQKKTSSFNFETTISFYPMF